MLRPRHLVLISVLFVAGPTWADSPPVFSAKFCAPEGLDARLIAITVGSDGLLYVTHDGPVQTRVSVYSPDGTYLGPWCQGANCGQPTSGDFDDLCFTDHGTAFAADILNQCVLKLTSGGVVLAKWGSHGEPPGSGYWYPGGIGVDAGGFVYVAAGNRVEKFTEDGAFVLEWPVRNGSMCLDIDVDGNIVVASYMDEYAQVFSSVGTLVREWNISPATWGEYSGAGIQLNDLFCDPWGGVYIIQDCKWVAKYSSTGEFLYTIGSETEGDGAVGTPLGVAVDADGNVYVTDLFLGCIFKYAAAPTPIRPATWGTLKRKYLPR